MDYYEELGLDRTATDEEIKKAHRRLAKLFHPDQQTDESMRALAETQMRRVNEIVGILSDPEKRRDYDDDLLASTPGLSFEKVQRRVYRSWRWWAASTAAAIILTVGAVWFFAAKWGSSFGEKRTPTYIASGAETNPAVEGSHAAGSSAGTDRDGTVLSDSDSDEPAKKGEPVVRALESDRVPSAAPRTTVVVADVPPHKQLHLTAAAVPKLAPRAAISLPSAPVVATSGFERTDVAALPDSALPSPPKPGDLAAPSVAASAQRHDALEGEWVYSPAAPEKHRSGFYPPEYIRMKIWDEDGLRGEYHAKYHVADKEIPPEVNFALLPDGNPRRFTWVSGNGSKGVLEVSAMDASSIRIEWHTTVYGQGPALTAGTATLVRQNP